jgi:hypothetical protein
MIDRVKDRFGIEAKRLIGDTAYGTAEFLGWMVNEANIEPHVPVWDKGEHTDGRFGRSDFIFDEQDDTYTCPNGKELKRYRRNFKKPRTGITKSNEIKYRSSKPDCAACPMKEQCCPNTEIRKITRSVHEPARDVARAVRKTPAYRRDATRSKEGRDAVRAHEAHPESGPIATTRHEWCSGRVPAHGDGAKPEAMAKMLGTGPPGIQEMAVN